MPCLSAKRKNTVIQGNRSPTRGSTRHEVHMLYDATSQASTGHEPIPVEASITQESAAKYN